MKNKKYLRYCPRCKNKIYYSSKYTVKYYNEKNKICQSCAQFGKTLNQNHRKKISDSLKGNKNAKGYKQTKEHIKRRTEFLGDLYNGRTYEELYGIKRANERKEKISKNNGKYWLGKHHSSISKKKMRISHIKWIEENKNNNLPIHPIFNKNACIVIDKYGQQNNYNFQHAMNGGEYKIEELGYWVDGYDKEKNTIVEYYENRHRKTIKKDEQRIQEIKKFLSCTVIIIKEWTNKIEFLN
jgi:hypothetical protein